MPSSPYATSVLPLVRLDLGLGLVAPPAPRDRRDALIRHHALNGRELVGPRSAVARRREREVRAALAAARARVRRLRAPGLGVTALAPVVEHLRDQPEPAHQTSRRILRPL